MQGIEHVGIFWDYENCHPTSNIPGHVVVNNIRQLAHKYGSITSYKAYLEISEQFSAKASNLRSEFQSSGVSLIDCPHNGRKDVADKMMLVDMMAFAIDHPAPATIVLISGDRDFAYAVSILRLRRYNVVLILPSKGVHISLRSQASAVFDWNVDVLGKYEEIASASAQEPGSDSKFYYNNPPTDIKFTLKEPEDPPSPRFFPHPPHQSLLAAKPLIEELISRNECKEQIRNLVTTMKRGGSLPATGIESVIDKATNNSTREISGIFGSVAGKSPSEHSNWLPHKTKGGCLQEATTIRSLDPLVPVAQRSLSKPNPHIGSSRVYPDTELATSTLSKLEPELGSRQVLSAPTDTGMAEKQTEGAALDMSSQESHFLDHERLPLQKSSTVFTVPATTNESPQDDTLALPEDVHEAGYGISVSASMPEAVETSPYNTRSDSMDPPLSPRYAQLSSTTSDEGTSSVRQIRLDPPRVMRQPPAAETPAQTVAVSFADTDAYVFDLLIDVLKYFKLRGIERPGRTFVAKELVRRNACVYKDAGVERFKDFITIAEERGLVRCGGLGKSSWITFGPTSGSVSVGRQLPQVETVKKSALTLNPGAVPYRPFARVETPLEDEKGEYLLSPSKSIFFGSVSTSPETVTWPKGISRLTSRREDIPLGLLSLVDLLQDLRIQGLERPNRSIVAIALVRRNRMVYQEAGVSSFREFSLLAENFGIIQLGGAKSSAWIALHPDWCENQEKEATMDTKISSWRQPTLLRASGTGDVSLTTSSALNAEIHRVYRPERTSSPGQSTVSSTSSIVAQLEPCLSPSPTADSCSVVKDPCLPNAFGFKRNCASPTPTEGDKIPPTPSDYMKLKVNTTAASLNSPRTKSTNSSLLDRISPASPSLIAQQTSAPVPIDPIGSYLNTYDEAEAYIHKRLFPSINKLGPLRSQRSIAHDE